MNDIVYKVVRDIDGLLVSAIRGPVELVYHVGVPTTASIALPTAGPLVFAQYSDALTFAKFLSRKAAAYGTQDIFSVYSAIGENVRPVAYLCSDGDVGWLSKFWASPEQFCGVLSFKAPPGTLVTDSLTLDHRVWSSDAHVLA